MRRMALLRTAVTISGVAIVISQSLPRHVVAEELSNSRGGCASGSCGQTLQGVCFHVGDGCGTLGKCDGVGNGECVDLQFCTSNGCGGRWGASCVSAGQSVLVSPVKVGGLR